MVITPCISTNKFKNARKVELMTRADKQCQLEIAAKPGVSPPELGAIAGVAILPSIVKCQCKE